MRARLELILAVALAACADKAGPQLRADIPLEAGDRSVIAALVRGSEIELRALSAQNGVLDPSWALSFEAEEKLRVLALTYGSDLDALDLQRGPIAPAIMPPDRPIPVPSRTLELELSDGVLTDWHERMSPDPLLDGIRLPVTNRCNSFELIVLPLLDVSLVHMAVAVDADRVLFGDLAGGLFVSPPGGPITRLAQTGTYFDAISAGPGEVLLASSDGRIERGRLSRASPPVLALTLDSTVAPGRSVLFLDGEAMPGARELFAATDEGTIWSDDGTGWTRLYQRNSPRGLLRVGPKSVRAIHGYEFFITGFDDGVEQEEAVLDSNIAGGVTVIAKVPGLGVLAGSEYGQIHHRVRKNVWELLDAIDPVATQTRGIVSYGSGWVYARPDAILEVTAAGLPCLDQLVVQPNDPAAPEIGVEVGREIGFGARAELTVVGEDVAAFGQSGAGAERHPVLFWFKKK